MLSRLDDAPFHRCAIGRSESKRRLVADIASSDGGDTSGRTQNIHVVRASGLHQVLLDTLAGTTGEAGDGAY